MARYFYTLKTSETERPINDKIYNSITEARKDALKYVKWTNYTDSVIIERNLKNYMLMDDSGAISYMSGDYIMKNSPIVIINPNGTIRSVYGSPIKKRKTVKKKMAPFGL